MIVCVVVSTSFYMYSKHSKYCYIHCYMFVCVYSSLLILLIHSFIYEATDCNVIAHSVTHLLTLHPLSYSVSVQ